MSPQPPDPILVAFLMCRNEADILPESLAALSQQVDAIFATDDSDDEEGSERILRQSEACLRIYHFDPKKGPYTDGIFLGTLLIALREGWDSERPWILPSLMGAIEGTQPSDLLPMMNLWIAPIGADEIYYRDLREACQRAASKNKGVVTCNVADFVLHTSERETDWEADAKLPIQTARQWYFTEHAEIAAFRWNPTLEYDPSQHKRVLPPQLWEAEAYKADNGLIRKHYPHRNPVDAWLRAMDRVSSGWQDQWAKALLESRTAFWNKSPFTGAEIKRWGDG